MSLCRMIWRKDCDREVGRRLALVPALLAVALSGSCSDDQSARRTSDTQPTVVAGDSSAEQGGAYDGAEPRAPSVAETMPLSLGDRFEWCLGMQRSWEAWHRSRAEFVSAAEAVVAANEAYSALEDELDRAQALEVLLAAQEHREPIADSLAEHYRAWLHIIVGPESQFGIETQRIAASRAREAYQADADPAIAALIRLQWAEQVPAFQLPPTTTTDSVDAVARQRLALGSFDETFDELKSIHRLVVDLGTSASAALQDMHDGRDRLLASASGEGALAGLHQFQAGNLSLDEANTASQQLVSQGWILATAYDDSRWDALAEGAITESERVELDEGGHSVIDVARAIAADGEAIRELRVQGNRLFIPDEAVGAFVLGDETGLASFWSSLVESCKA